MEFSSDREFYSNYLEVKDILIKAGWKEGTPKKARRKISEMLTKDGYGIFLLYGCEEDIKDEIL